MNKKKMLAIALAVCLIAILSFSTLAWFTDTEEVKNTFTVGSVKIEQHEQQLDEDGNPEDFVDDDQLLLPIVKVDDPASDPNYQDKIVTVENVGNNPAYVRTHIAIPATLVGYLNLDVNVNDNSGWVFEYSTEVTVNEVACVVYTYRYDEILDLGVTTPALLNGVYLKAEVDMKEASDGSLQFCMWDSANEAWSFSGFVVRAAGSTTVNTVDVVVASQAVQSQGFGSAVEALTAAFGSSTPWG